MKNITDFLQSDPLHYDFTNDCTTSKEYQAKRGYEKYFIYRSPRPNLYPTAVSVMEKNYQLYGKIGDPDSESKLLQNIYSLLWPEIKELKNEYMMNNNGWIYSDTMISIQTTLNSYIGRKMPEVFKKYNVKRVSNKMCIELFETDSGFRRLLDESEDLAHLITAYHTLGNYLPVCCGFNIARSGYYGTHDYSDLTLTKIKEYYDARAGQNDFTDSFTCSEIKILQLLHCEHEVVSCYNWLNSFDGWGDFITKNLLQDFVDENNQPILLCKGHSWESPQVQDFDEFFRNTWQMIEKRSCRMIEALEKKASKFI